MKEKSERGRERGRKEKREKEEEGGERERMVNLWTGVGALQETLNLCSDGNGERMWKYSADLKSGLKTVLNVS